jgi:hypothetical protein
LTCNLAGAVTLLALGHCAHEATTPGKARANKSQTKEAPRPHRLATQSGLLLCLRLGQCAHAATTPVRYQAKQEQTKEAPRPPRLLPRLATQPALSLCWRLGTVHTKRQHQVKREQTKEAPRAHLGLQLSRRCPFAAAWTLCTRSDNTGQNESKRKKLRVPTSTCNSASAFTLHTLRTLCTRRNEKHVHLDLQSSVAPTVDLQPSTAAAASKPKCDRIFQWPLAAYSAAQVLVPLPLSLMASEYKSMLG